MCPNSVEVQVSLSSFFERERKSTDDAAAANLACTVALNVSTLALFTDAHVTCHIIYIYIYYIALIVCSDDLACVCVCVCVCVYIYIHTCMHTHTQTNINTCVHTYIRTYIYIRMYIHIYIILIDTGVSTICPGWCVSKFC